MLFLQCDTTRYVAGDRRVAERLVLGVRAPPRRARPDGHDLVQAAGVSELGREPEQPYRGAAGQQDAVEGSVGIDAVQNASS